MSSLKNSIAILFSIGIFAGGNVAYANQSTAQNSNETAIKKDESLTSFILSFFGKDKHEKPKSSDAVSLVKPTEGNSGKYITLSEPEGILGNIESDKKITVTQSFEAKHALVFGMGNLGISSFSPSGIAGFGASSIGNKITFSYGDEESLRNASAVNVSFGSQFLIEPSSIMSPLYDGSKSNQINNRQVYNLSFDVGYAGFRLGASFSKERKLYDSGLKGFDFGFGYSQKNWGADIKFGEYRKERDLLFSTISDFYDTVYTMEIGADYRIRSNIRFTGRFTYYAYGQENDLNRLNNSQVFFLGTNVNF